MVFPVSHYWKQCWKCSLCRSPHKPMRWYLQVQWLTRNSDVFIISGKLHFPSNRKWHQCIGWICISPVEQISRCVSRSVFLVWVAASGSLQDFYRSVCFLLQIDVNSLYILDFSSCIHRNYGSTLPYPKCYHWL